ncbi:putative sulfotransferase 1A1 [Apostichopus japonicus]|uniref:Putative sulfotransferase 1A1 n=1 Tax=Stichopus japonicus TaxID=307972 RepID=A0A2G8KTL2_STIJA|nr:putative sulfotransferase 1A1 [Apostichopus japonicus]
MVVRYSLEEQNDMLRELTKPFGLPEPLQKLNEMHEYEGVPFSGFVPAKSLEIIRDWETRDDDIFITTYPKSGTHWMWEIALLILAKGRPDDIDRTKMLGTGVEFLYPPEMTTPSHQLFAELESPRVMCTHLPWKFLPKQLTEGNKGRIIYVMRNPKDTLASTSRFLRAPAGQVQDQSTWKFFFNSFLSGAMSHGSWFDHVHTYWTHREQENVFFTSYEKLKLDFQSVARPLSKFLLGEELDEDSLRRLEENASMKGMKKSYDEIEKKRPNGHMITKAMGRSSFIQKGVIGSWKNFFSVAENELFDEVCQEKMADWEFKPVYEG